MAIGILGQYHWQVFCQATTTVLLENSSNIYPEQCLISRWSDVCYNCCSLSERSALSNLLSGVTDERCHWIGWLRPRAFHLSTFHLPQPSTFPPSTLPSLPRHPRFSFLPAARCSQQYPDPGKQLWQSLNVRRDKIWRHTKCDDSMGNSMKYDSWQLTDK